MNLSKETKIEPKKIHANDTSDCTRVGLSAVDYEAKTPQDKGKTTIVGISEYRKILADNVSTDEQIIKQLQYIEALCRNVIRSELKSYVEKNKK